MKISRAVAALIFLTAGCTTPTKSELDAEVRRLCAIDGGMRVYQTTSVPSDGKPRIPAKAHATVQDEYYFESDTTYYRRGNPEMWRTEYRIVRARDAKIMGTSVVYTRRGGDMPSPMHDSSFSCPGAGSQPSLENSIFTVGS
jgi:hypothetical protein